MKFLPQQFPAIAAIFLLNSLLLFAQTKSVATSDYLFYDALEVYSDKTSDYFKQDINSTMNVDDVNGDSYDDVALFSKTSFTVYTDNDLSEPALEITPNEMEWILGAESLDFNGDGRSDVILYFYNVDYTKSRFEFYTGHTTLTLIKSFEINISESLIHDIGEDKFGCSRIGDINQDGVEDFVLYGHSHVNIYHGGDTIPAEPLHTLKLGASMGCRTVAAGDLNEDGADDFAVGGMFYPNVYVYFGGAERTDYSQPDHVLSKDSTLQHHSSEYDGFCYSMVSGDYNGDDVNDLAIMPLQFRESNDLGDGIAGLHIFYGGSDMDDQHDLLLRIPAGCFEIDVVSYINAFAGEMSTIQDIDQDGNDEILLGGWWVRSLDNTSSQHMKHGVIFSLSSETGELKPLIQLISNYRFFGGSNRYQFDTHSAIMDFDRDGKSDLLARTLTLNDFTGCEISLYDIDPSTYKTLSEASVNYELFDQGLLRIYPNPVDNILKLDLQQSGLFHLEILSLSGQMVKQFPGIPLDSEFDLGSLKSGVYLIRVFDGETIHTEKLIKK